MPEPLTTIERRVYHFLIDFLAEEFKESGMM